MKHKYESTLDENFNRAFELCSSEHNYELLIDLLKTGNIPEKQYSALFINELKSQEDAKIFISNLVNCDGKIREAVALKISEFIHIEQYREYFSNYPEIFAQSTIDINANISRIIIDSLVYLNDNPSFGGKYSKILQKYIQDAFDGLDKIVAERMGSKVVGFNAVKDIALHKPALATENNVTQQDLVKYGLIPELVGRIPVIATLEPLDKDAMVRILKEPKNALLKQYQKLFEFDGVELEFDDGAVEAIAQKAFELKSGARGLRAVTEGIMMKYMYDVPSDPSIKKLIITKEMIV